MLPAGLKSIYKSLYYDAFAFKQSHRPLISVTEDNPSERARLLAKPRPDKRYVVFFTPRSGSSRLTDLAEATGVLSRPGEGLNPAFVPTMAGKFSARNVAEYVDLLTRVRAQQGVFGVEATYMHLQIVFGSSRRFLDIVQPTAFLWLIREDIVAQAVSISRLVQTRVAHAKLVSDAAQQQAEEAFSYNPDQIFSALYRLLWMEERTERLIARHRLAPLRLSYEGTLRCPEADLMARIAGHVGVDLPRTELCDAGHQRLAGTKGRDFADRFRHENARFLSGVARSRAGRLARLDIAG